MRGTNPPCRKALHLHLTTNVRKDQHLYSTMQGTNPSCWKGSALTSDNKCQKGLHSHLIMQEVILTFDHVGTNPIVTSEWLSTHIWHGRNHSFHHDRKELNPRFRIPSNWPGASILLDNGIQRLYLIMWEHIPQSPQNGLALTSDMEGTNPPTMTKWLSPYISPWKELILSPCQNGSQL